MMVIWDGGMIKRHTFNSGIKDSAVTANDARGVTAAPTPSSAAATRETTTMTTTIMTTTIASSATIESMGAVVLVLVPHLTRRGFNVVVVVTVLSCAVRKCADARAFERHRYAHVPAFVRGRGWRDDGADGVDADDIIC
jgi:hypothetical protein